jgi:hypothetical protein
MSERSAITEDAGTSTIQKVRQEITNHPKEGRFI